MAKGSGGTGSGKSGGSSGNDEAKRARELTKNYVASPGRANNIKNPATSSNKRLSTKVLRKDSTPAGPNTFKRDDLGSPARAAAMARASSDSRTDNVQMRTGRNNRASTKKVREMRSKTVTKKLRG